MPTIIVIDGVTLTLKKYPEFAAGTPVATDITLFSDPINGGLFKTTMDNLIANILNVDGSTITGDGSSGNPLVASVGGPTASEGLIAIGNDVRLGDTSAPGAAFTANRFIDASTFKLSIEGTIGWPNYIFNVTTNSGNGGTVKIEGSGLITLRVNNTGTSTAMYVTANDGTPAQIEGIFTSTNLQQEILQIVRTTTGTAANNIAGYIGFYIETDGGSSQESGRIISRWIDAADASRTSQTVITGVLSTSTVDLITLNADGSWQIRPITATAASAITPAEGMLLFVSTTDATFTSIGLWCYYNGAWNAL